MGLKVILFFGLCYLTQCGIAQESDYKEAFPDKITFRLALQTTSNNFTLRDKITRNKTEFIPNDKSYLGLSVKSILAMHPIFYQKIKTTGNLS